ncbi:hypothetical protein OOL41_004662 [Salmonella enterica]|nr:hypothetical protein [Salmonella enterica]
MEPKSERAKLKASATESVYIFLNVVRSVLSRGMALTVLGWLMMSGYDLFIGHNQNHAADMRYGACMMAWLFILTGNFVWLTYNRFRINQSREPAGKYGYLMPAIIFTAFEAEFLLTGVIVWMVSHNAGMDITGVSVMSLTIMALVISVSLKCRTVTEDKVIR